MYGNMVLGKMAYSYEFFLKMLLIWNVSRIRIVTGDGIIFAFSFCSWMVRDYWISYQHKLGLKLSKICFEEYNANEAVKLLISDLINL